MKSVAQTGFSRERSGFIHMEASENVVMITGLTRAKEEI
jgi:hypothetical protein